MPEQELGAIIAFAEGLAAGAEMMPPCAPADSGDLTRLAAALRVLGERQREARLARQLLTVVERVQASRGFDEVCSHIYDSFRSLIPYDRIGVSLVEEGGEHVVARWARIDGGEVLLGRGYRAALAGSSLETVLRTGRPRVIDDLSTRLDGVLAEATRLILAEGFRASLTCPLLVAGRPVGFVFFSSRQIAAYADAHSEVFAQIAGQIAQMVERARTADRLRELDAARRHLLGIAAHGGRISVESQPGVGATFCLCLPVDGPPAGAAVALLDEG